MRLIFLLAFSISSTCFASSTNYDEIKSLIVSRQYETAFKKIQGFDQADPEIVKLKIATVVNGLSCDLNWESVKKNAKNDAKTTSLFESPASVKSAEIEVFLSDLKPNQDLNKIRAEVKKDSAKYSISISSIEKQFSKTKDPSMIAAIADLEVFRFWYCYRDTMGKAKELYEQAYELGLKSADLLYKLSKINSIHGEYAKAIRFFKLAEADYSNDYEFHYRFANALKWDNQIEEAARHLELSRKYAPNDVPKSRPLDFLDSDGISHSEIATLGLNINKELKLSDNKYKVKLTEQDINALSYQDRFKAYADSGNTKKMLELADEYYELTPKDPDSVANIMRYLGQEKLVQDFLKIQQSKQSKDNLASGHLAYSEALMYAMARKTNFVKAKKALVIAKQKYALTLKEDDKWRKSADELLVGIDAEIKKQNE